MSLWQRFLAWWHGPEVVFHLPPAKPIHELAPIGCPCCGIPLDVLKKIPVGASCATVVCSCGEQVEMHPDSYFGWRSPRVEHRKKSYI